MDLDLKNLMPPTEPSMSTRAEPARIAPLKEASPSPSPLQKPEPKPRPRRVAQSSWRREAAAWLVGTLMVLGLLAAFLLVMLSMEGGGP
jgi:hypothetical protein